MYFSKRTLLYKNAIRTLINIKMIYLIISIKILSSILDPYNPLLNPFFLQMNLALAFRTPILLLKLNIINILMNAKGQL